MNVKHMITIEQNKYISKSQYCPRCRFDSHNLRNCTADRIIKCFRCGRPDVTIKECPDCEINQAFDQKTNKAE